MEKSLPEEEGGFSSLDPGVRHAVPAADFEGGAFGRSGGVAFWVLSGIRKNLPPRQERFDEAEGMHAGNVSTACDKTGKPASART